MEVLDGPFKLFLSTFTENITHTQIFLFKKLNIVYSSINISKNPLFLQKKNKKLALLLTKRACKGGIIMKKIVLLFVALV